MEQRAFHHLLKLAFQISLRSRILWFFGFGLALAAVLNGEIASRFFPEFYNGEQLSFSTVSHVLASPMLLLFLPVFLLRVFGKSSLITALPLALPQATLSHNFQTLHPRKLFSHFWQALLLEILVFLFLLVFGFVFALPALYAYFERPLAFDPLILFGGLSFFLLFLFTFFVKELAFFYLLLSRLPIRASLENAHALFIRFFPRCLAFGVYALAILLLFTFSVDLFILIFGELFHGPDSLTLLIQLLFLSWFSVFYQALWFFFFRDLATPPVPPEKVAPEKEPLIKEKVTETPTTPGV